MNCPKLFTLNIIYGNGIQGCSSEVLYVHYAVIMSAKQAVTTKNPILPWNFTNFTNNI